MCNNFRTKEEIYSEIIKINRQFFEGRFVWLEYAKGDKIKITPLEDQHPYKYCIEDQNGYLTWFTFKQLNDFFNVALQNRLNRLLRFDGQVLDY